MADWLGAHVRAVQFLGGVPEVVVPDNLKSGVSRPHRYEPDLNPSYQDWATHYGVAVIPARVAKPRDKAKVEVGVQVVERWLLARLRHRPFFSLAELNQALSEALPALNQRPFRKLPGCRQSLFETLECPLLRPLPAQPYQYAEWKQVRVNIDYHVEVDGHYYSVPYGLVKQRLEARLSAPTVELFHRGQRVASHPRFGPASAAIPPSPSTCRGRTAATPSGPRSGWWAGRLKPGLPPPPWWRPSSPPGPIPNRAFAPV